MDEYRIARRVLMAEASGGRVRGRSRLGWLLAKGCEWRLRERLERVESPGGYVDD